MSQKRWYRTLRKHQSGLGGNSIGDSVSALEGDGEAPPGAVPPDEAPPGAVPPGEAPSRVVSPGVDVWG